jgi:hypothetical protein
MKRALLLAALCALGCDDRTRVGVTVHAGGLPEARRAAVNRLTVGALVPAQMQSYALTVDITPPLAFEERIVVELPDATPAAAIQVAALHDLTTIAEGTAPLTQLERGHLVQVDLTLGPEPDLDLGMGADLLTVPAPFQIGGTTLLGSQPTQVVLVGNGDGVPGDELYSSDGTNTLWVLNHGSAPNYFSSTSFSAISVVPRAIALGKLRSTVAHDDLVVAGPFGTTVGNTTVCVLDGIDRSELARRDLGLIDAANAVVAGMIPIAGGPASTFVGVALSSEVAYMDFTTGLTSLTTTLASSPTTIAFGQLDTGPGEIAFGDAKGLHVCRNWEPGSAPQCNLEKISETVAQLWMVDADGQGGLDLVTREPMPSARVHFLANDGATPAGFTELLAPSLIGTAAGIAVADFDGNGYADVAFIDVPGSGVSFRFRDGSGEVSTAALPFITMNKLSFLRLADLDSNALPDLVAVDDHGVVYPLVHKP